MEGIAHLIAQSKSRRRIRNIWLVSQSEMFVSREILNKIDAFKVRGEKGSNVRTKKQENKKRNLPLYKSVSKKSLTLCVTQRARDDNLNFLSLNHNKSDNLHTHTHTHTHTCRHHHHHHVAMVARISLTLSRHSSLSFVALGRSSRQHPVYSHSC